MISERVKKNKTKSTLYNSNYRVVFKGVSSRENRFAKEHKLYCETTARCNSRSKEYMPNSYSGQVGTLSQIVIFI